MDRNSLQITCLRMLLFDILKTPLFISEKSNLLAVSEGRAKAQYFRAGPSSALTQYCALEFQHLSSLFCS